MISPEALEKARAIALDVFRNAVDSDDGSECMDMPVAIDIIATALQAERDAVAPKLPDDVAALVTALKGVDHMSVEDCFLQSPLFAKAATTIQSLVARNAELEAGLRGLLDCPDIADNDYNDEETHAAERVARSLLNKDRQP